MSERKSLWERFKSKLRSLGGEINAWGRQGAKDLHNAVAPAFPASQKSLDEAGTPLNPTSQIVTAELEGRDNGYATLKERLAALSRHTGDQPKQGLKR
jgi:hypothetical protein